VPQEVAAIAPPKVAQLGADDAAMRVAKWRWMLIPMVVLLAGCLPRRRPRLGGRRRRQRYRWWLHGVASVRPMTDTDDIEAA
jgi:hypothetical protein